MVEAFIALLALTLMEIVLGIDNIVFITVATSHLPPERQSDGRRWGLILALGTRILLLCGIFWVAQLITPVFSLTDFSFFPAENAKKYFMIDEFPGAGGHAFSETEVPKVLDEHKWYEFVQVSWRDIILIFGGLFLIRSSVKEIHEEVEGADEHAGASNGKKKRSFVSVIVQIAIMDIIFSLDSVITAVGMADQLWVMITAIIIAVGIMLLFANQVGDFVEANPTIKMLALNFLLLIGVMLVAEGIGTPISKGYIYFAMGFSLLVEFFNMRVRTRQV